VAVTKIVSTAQVEYHLTENWGCDKHDVGHQVEYRLGADPLQWFGEGVREFGLVPGEAVDKDAARALMDGCDPVTGERLMDVTLRTAESAKLGATPFVEAVRAAAEAAGCAPLDLFLTPVQRTAWQRLVRQVTAKGAAYRYPIADMERLAAPAGVVLEDVYRADAVASARANRNERVRVDVAGEDVSLTLPKSASLLWGLSDAESQARIERLFVESAHESGELVWSACSYGVTGKQGEGRLAERVGTTGPLGWLNIHHGARPVEGTVGDPHLHIHMVLAHMVHCEDGSWRVPASGGRDYRRHSRAIEELAFALFRTKMTAEFGTQWEYDPAKKTWEVAAIPPELAAEFSRRNRQILAEGGTELTSAQRRLVAAQTREAKQDIEATDVLAAWKDNAEAVLNDGQGHGGAQRLADILAAAMPGPPPAGTGLDLPDPQQIAAVVFDPDTGLTAGTKAFDRAQALAEVAAALPPGLLVPGELEALTDAVLRAEGYPVALRDLHASHHSNTDRYTTADVLEAEETIRTQARVRIGEQLRAAVAAAAVEQGLAGHEQRAGIAYSAEQRAVLERILTGQCGVDAVEGLAGAGKTVIFAGANAVWKEHGKTVAGAAMYAVAAQNLQAESGIESATVARWLQRIREGEGLDGVDVLVVDEAALVDDRALAVLLAEAWTTGTQVVLVGDHQQLKPIGIGGGFAEVHRIVKGLSLTENRRQVDAKERATLEKWRLGDRAEALRDLAANGRVHATDAAEQSAEAMLAAWDRQRGQWSDPHEQLRSLLLLAARNRDVDVLNQGARAIRRAAGELADDVAFTLADGGRLDVAVGDLVRVRVNDYRARRGVGEVDVLNGYRGVVLQADSRRGVLVEWQRTSGPGRTVTEAAWFTPQQLQQGAVSHAYAMTIALAQGLTCQRALVAGVGADAYTLYPALTRARLGTDLWLPLESLEEPEVRARLGAPEDDQVRLARAVAAYGERLDADRPDVMISDQVAERPRPDAEPDGGTRCGAGRRPSPGPVDPPLPGGGTATAVREQTVVTAEGDGDFLPQPPAEPAAERAAEPQPAAADAAADLLAAWRQRTADAPAASAEPGPEAVDADDLARRVDVQREDQAAAVAPPVEPAGQALPQPEQLDRAQREAIEQSRREALAAREQIRIDRTVPSWTARPMGHVRTRQLGPEIAKAQTLAAAARAEARATERRAEEAQASLGTDSTDGNTRAQLIGGWLDQVAAHYDLAHRALKAEQAAYKVAEAARTAATAADGQAARKPWRLKLAGTSRADQEKKAKDARTEARLAGDMATKYRNTADDERRAGHKLLIEAIKVIDPKTVVVELVAKPSEAIAQAALLRGKLADLAAGPWSAQDQRAVETLRKEAAAQHKTADKLGNTVVLLRAELEIRSTLSPQRQRAEEQARAKDSADQQAATQARLGKAYGKQYPKPGYQPPQSPSQGRKGPRI